MIQKRKIPQKNCKLTRKIFHLNKRPIEKLCAGRSTQEMIDSICGPKLGSGVHRDVYLLRMDDRFVVKVERDMRRAQFANASEWLNWKNNEEWTWFSEWLAPCEMIEQTGQILIQRRVFHLPKIFYPTEIPALFTDHKYLNFGWIEDKFVCCDYSFIPIYEIREGRSRMKRVRWWGSDPGFHL